jgi:hypothetical protein
MPAIAIWVFCLAPLGLGAAEPVETQSTLTFFGWSDQHVQVDGDGSHLIPAIDAMNKLPGTKYPERFGGVVAEPAFVFGCGDITEWPTTAAKNTYQDLITSRLKFPACDIMGNHDDGGKSPSSTIKNWLISRHGALSYTFDKLGVRFLCVYSEYDENLNSPAQPVAAGALEFIRRELARTPPGTPVVAALHLCFDAITNRDELLDAFGGANVILVLGGHYHKAKVDRHRNVDFVQLPSPAPKNSAGQVTLIRITPDRLLAIPYSYEKNAWSEEPKEILDKRLRVSNFPPVRQPGRAHDTPEMECVNQPERASVRFPACPTRTGR